MHSGLVRVLCFSLRRVSNKFEYIQMEVISGRVPSAPTNDKQTKPKWKKWIRTHCDRCALSRYAEARTQCDQMEIASNFAWINIYVSPFISSSLLRLFRCPLAPESLQTHGWDGCVACVWARGTSNGFMHSHEHGFKSILHVYFCLSCRVSYEPGENGNLKSEFFMRSVVRLVAFIRRKKR